MLTPCIWWVWSWGWEVAEAGFSDDDDDDDDDDNDDDNDDSVISVVRCLINKVKDVTLYTINKKYVFKPHK